MERFKVSNFAEVFGTETYITIAFGFISYEDIKSLNDESTSNLLNAWIRDNPGREEKAQQHNMSADDKILTEAYDEGIKIGDYAFIFYDVDYVYEGYRPVLLVKSAM